MGCTGTETYVRIGASGLEYVDFKDLIVHMNNGETYPVSARKKNGLKKLIE